MARREQGYDYLVKLLVIGNSGVGKTNMLLRFCQNNFMTSHLTTIGIDFKIKTVLIDGSKIRLQIWDTAGQQRFKTITQTYYRGAMGIILVYSIEERESFQDIQNWVKQIKMHATDDVIKILVGNKSDTSKREVSYEEGKGLAQELDMEFYETSAKENCHIQDCFMSMAIAVKGKLCQDTSAVRSNVKVCSSMKEVKKKACC